MESVGAFDSPYADAEVCAIRQLSGDALSEVVLVLPDDIEGHHGQPRAVGQLVLFDGGRLIRLGIRFIRYQHYT